MIRAVLGTIMMRSIERDRPLPAWLRAASGRSRRLGDLERCLRTTHARLSASTAGLIGPAPHGLAARTVAALPRGPRSAPRLRTLPLGGWPGVTIAAVGALAAAAAVVTIFLTATPPPDAAPFDLSVPTTIGRAGESADGGPAAPETLVSVLRAPDDVAAGAFTGGLMTEAQRLRDDTRAAADFVLSRMRMLGVAPRQSGG